MHFRSSDSLFSGELELNGHENSSIHSYIFFYGYIFEFKDTSPNILNSQIFFCVFGEVYPK